MRIGRAIITPTILTLGVAGAALAGTAVPTVVTQAVSIQVLAQGPTANYQIYYYA